MTSKTRKRKTSKVSSQRRYKPIHIEDYYSLRSILGNSHWAIFYILLGAREAGKSYSITNYFVKKWKEKKIPFTWLRLNEASTKKMLANNAEKLIDPDLYRKYDLDLTVKGTNVYDKGEKMCQVLALSTFANDKGTALFDKDFLNNPDMQYHICLDEFQLEKTQRKQGDIAYQFVQQLENLVRSTKDRMKIFLVGNTLEEASDIMELFNFIPMPGEFGRYRLKAKRAVIDYMPVSEKYKARRRNSAGDILAGQTSNYTNALDNMDQSMILSQRDYRPKRPTHIIHFTQDIKFTIWDGFLIKKYNNEKVLNNIIMKPYLSSGFQFDAGMRDTIFSLYDQQLFSYVNPLVYKLFTKYLMLLKPRGTTRL